MLVVLVHTKHYETLTAGTTSNITCKDHIAGEEGGGM